MAMHTLSQKLQKATISCCSPSSDGKKCLSPSCQTAPHEVASRNDLKRLLQPRAGAGVAKTAGEGPATTNLGSVQSSDTVAHHGTSEHTPYHSRSHRPCNELWQDEQQSERLSALKPQRLVRVLCNLRPRGAAVSMSTRLDHWSHEFGRYEQTSCACGVLRWPLLPRVLRSPVQQQLCKEL